MGIIGKQINDGWSMILTYEGSKKLRKSPPALCIIGESGGMDKVETVLSTVGNSMIITVGQFCTDDENNK